MAVAVAVGAGAVRRMLRYWRPRIAPEWAVELVFDSPDVDNGNMAHALRPRAYLFAEIALAVGWRRAWPDHPAQRAWPPALRVEVALVHELLHLVLHDLDAAIDDVVETLSDAAAAAVTDRQNLYLERVVERLACALVAERHGFDPLGAPRSRSD